MINMTVLVNQLIQLFLMICTGYLIYKINILNDTINKHLNSFIINVTMPLMIVSTVWSMDTRPEGFTVIVLFAVGIGFFALMPFVSYLVVKFMRLVLRIEVSQQGPYMFMLIFSNLAFMGIPILQAAFGENGDTAVFYASVLVIFFNLSVFSYGVFIIGYGNEVKTAFNFRKLISPGIISSILALLFYLFDVRLPDVLESTVKTLGGLTSPLAMILIGSTLASMKLRELFTDWKIYIFILIRQFLLPILFYPIFRLIISDDLLFNVIFIEFLMPAANVGLMLATEYNLDTKLVSKTVFISTILSLLSIPVMFYICGYIYG